MRGGMERSDMPKRRTREATGRAKRTQFADWRVARSIGFIDIGIGCATRKSGAQPR